MTDLTVVIPVFNEDIEVLTKTYSEIQSLGFNVIIVDDGGTMDIPSTFNSISYSPHMGYGYAIKRGIEAADTELVMTMDGDGQHTATDAKKLYDVYKMIPDCKMVVGERWNLLERPIRWWGRKIINFFASLVCGHYLVDLNSGMRIVDRKIAISYRPILCDTFSFTTSLSMAVITDGYKTAYFPIDVKPRVKGKSRVNLFRDGLVTLYYILWIGIALRTRKMRGFIRDIFGQ